MDISNLERFAKHARRYLMDQVDKKLTQILAVGSEARRINPKQVEALEQKLNPNKADSLSRKALIDQVAYTWFNRFSALRYMDVNGYNKMNIVSPLPGKVQPEILEEAKAGYIDEQMVLPSIRQRVFDLLSGKESHPDPQSEAYRMLIRAVCNYYSQIMPFLFERIEHWTELLMPDDLLSESSILAHTRAAMTPGACEDVEVIGWLYQYYISEKKDAVQAGVKKGKKVQSADLPAVTQLFTPHWIVRYMVQNSLGRLWLQSHPDSALKDKMEFYVAQDAVPAEDEDTDNVIISQEQRPALQEIKFCDPCCGSGHILTYAFDLLYDIYSEEGYDPTEIPRLIIEKNLYGIEIDERAAELAAFALSMKAREKDRLWFSRGIKPQICRLEKISFSEEEIEAYMEECGRDIFTLNFERMLSQFEDADAYGSLIVPHEQDIDAISEILNSKDFGGNVFLAFTHNKVLNLLSQADYLSSKYQVVVTNPPYLGGRGMNKKLSNYLQDNYNDVKSDLFSAFVVRCAEFGLPKAMIGIMSPNVWMYISSYEKLRKWILEDKTLTNLVELPLSGFTGATVQICAYNFMNFSSPNHEGDFVRLVGFKGADKEMAEYTQQAIVNPGCGWFYRCMTSDFTKIPGAPIAYWVSEKVRDIFAQHPPLESIADAKVGLQTGDNNRFLRYWFEVSMQRIGLGMKDKAEALASQKKWFPYNKGGEFRKWYGNQDYVVNWENDGEEIRNFYDARGKLRSRPQNTDFYFRESVSWSFISSSFFGVRYYNEGFIFDVAGSSCFSDHHLFHITRYLCSLLSSYFLSITNPTLNFQVGNVQQLPIKITEFDLQDDKGEFTYNLISISSKDWNSYETSWDFTELPMIRETCERRQMTLNEAYESSRQRSIEMTLNMHELEEENNRFFIEAYGLQDELSSEVPLKEITLTCNPFYRYKVDEEIDGRLREARVFPINKDIEQRLLADTMKELISYSVGCMFGRYSLDKPGLILANQGESIAVYLIQIPKPVFRPDENNVLPILDKGWFTDDIVSRFQEFLKVSFGEENYSTNLSYIENALGKTLRNYFLRDFYDDHVKRYKKRPIYWLFSSPKGSFNALIYMHRYTPDTVSIILNNYLKEYVFKLNAQLVDLEQIEISAISSQKEKIVARKELDRIAAIITELEYWERDTLYSLATSKIEIDLDDGVKANYPKFGDALKPIPGLS